MSDVDGGNHDSATRKNLDKMLSSKALQGLTNGRVPNPDALTEHGLRNHAARCKLESHNHLFDTSIGFFGQ